MKTVSLSAVIIFLSVTLVSAHPTDEEQIRQMISDIEHGWEHGDGTPFRDHFLDFEGARYSESGGQNEGLEDLIENHVEPEKDAIRDFELDYSNIEIHFEPGFAWAIADTRIKGELVRSGRVLDKAGRQTFLFRQVGDDWKVVHTHSSSRDYRPSE